MFLNVKLKHIEGERLIAFLSSRINHKKLFSRLFNSFLNNSIISDDNDTSPFTFHSTEPEQEPHRSIFKTKPNSNIDVNSSAPIKLKRGRPPANKISNGDSDLKLKSIHKKILKNNELKISKSNSI